MASDMAEAILSQARSYHQEDLARRRAEITIYVPFSDKESNPQNYYSIGIEFSFVEPHFTRARVKEYDARARCTGTTESSGSATKEFDDKLRLEFNREHVAVNTVLRSTCSTLLRVAVTNAKKRLHQTLLDFGEDPLVPGAIHRIPEWAQSVVSVTGFRNVSLMKDVGDPDIMAETGDLWNCQNDHYDDEIKDVLNLASSCASVWGANEKVNFLAAWSTNDNDVVYRLERLAYLAAKNNDIHVLEFVLARPEYIAHLRRLFPGPLKKDASFLKGWVERVSAPLGVAASEGNLESVRILHTFIKKNVSVFYPIGQGVFCLVCHLYNALQNAAINGRLDVVRFLVMEAKTPVSEYDDRCIRIARRAGHVQVVRFLIEDATNGRAYSHTQTNLAAYIQAVSDDHDDVMRYFARRSIERMSPQDLAINRARAKKLGHTTIEELFMDKALFRSFVGLADSVYFDD